MPIFETLWNLDEDNAKQPVWLWDGFLAQGNLTLLTSLWKSGKSTLIGLLLDRRRAGGQLLGRAVRPGATVVVTEESPELWAMRRRRLSFGPRVCFFFRPFKEIPDLPTWRAFIDQLLQLHKEHGIDLVIIDPAINFLPCNENNAASQMKALHEVRRLLLSGIAVLVLHHPAKGDPKLGQAARGAGALPAFADILLEMRIPPANPDTRRRRLHGFARYEETPKQLLAELNREGTDYAILDESADDEVPAPTFEILCEVLRDQPAALTVEDIAAEWLGDQLPPTTHTLWRWLKHGVALGVLVREGAGTKKEAFRYRLA